MLIPLMLSFSSIGVASAESPQAPALVHARAPTTKVVTTTYTCIGGQRTFSLRYDNNADAVFVSGSRRGIPLQSAAIQRANQALSKVDAVQDIVPECLDSVDTLLVFGRIQGKMSVFSLFWSGNDMTASEAQQVAECQ